MYSIRILTALIFLFPYCGYTQVPVYKDSSRYTTTDQPGIRSVILPASLIALGAYSIHHTTFINRFAIQKSRDRHVPDFHVTLDDWLQYAPIVAGYTYGALRDQDRLWLYTKRLILTQVLHIILVQTIKKQTHILRPNGDGYSAFPSGHTAQAFAAATLFSDHFAKHKPWWSVLSYTTAAAVGGLRILNNKHWANDVIAGAGFGILSAKVSQIIFR